MSGPMIWKDVNEISLKEIESVGSNWDVNEKHPVDIW